MGEIGGGREGEIFGPALLSLGWLAELCRAHGAGDFRVNVATFADLALARG